MSVATIQQDACEGTQIVEMPKAGRKRPPLRWRDVCRIWAVARHL